MISRRAAGVSLAAFLAASHANARQDPLASRFGGPFTLTSHRGERVTDKEFRGRFMLVYFGFTSCADTCPGDLLIIGQALDALGAAQSRVQPIFITVDPQTDRPETMAEWLANFHPRLVGLTGSEAEIASVAKAYRVHRLLLDVRPRSDLGRFIHLAHGPGAYGAKRDGAQTVDHGSLTYLMGPDGGFLTLFPTNTDVRRMSAAIASYLARLPR